MTRRRRERFKELEPSELAYAIENLKILGWPPLLPLLKRIYRERPENWVRSQVIDAIGWIPTKAATRFLIAILLEGPRSHHDWLIINGLDRSHRWYIDRQILIDVFYSKEFDDDARRAAVQCMSTVVSSYVQFKHDFSLQTDSSLRKLAQDAMEDRHPEIRMAGIELASHLDGFWDRIEHLAATDHAQAYAGTVSFHAKQAIVSRDEPKHWHEIKQPNQNSSAAGETIK